jgi:hypothetical protein
MITSLLRAMSLIGTLDEFRIADVLRLFANGGKTGLLTVADGAHEARVRFQKGSIVHAVAGPLQGDEAVFDLFGWKEGQLSFVPEERAVTPNVAKEVEELVNEGTRVGESFHRLRELIPSDRVAFQLGEGPGEGASYPLTRAAFGVLRLADGLRDVEEMLEETTLPRPALTQLLYELAQAGLVERVDVLRMLRAAAKGVSAKGLLGAESAEVDERLDQEWRRVRRFENGILRIEVRTAGGRAAPLGVSFRPGLLRELLLPRAVMTELGLKEGDEVAVRPVA